MDQALYEIYNRLIAERNSYAYEGKREAKARVFFDRLIDDVVVLDDWIEHYGIARVDYGSRYPGATK